MRSVFQKYHFGSNWKIDCGVWIIEGAWEEEWLKNMNSPIVGVSYLCSSLLLFSLLIMMLLAS